MGRIAHSPGILRIIALALCAAMPLRAHASATAQGVALNAAAGCADASLNLTLTTNAASREFWQATNAAGNTLAQREQATLLSNFNGTFNNFQIGLTATEPPNTRIASYAYVGSTPPSAADTAEFFVYYNCTTRQILLSCFGPYGTCPRTAVQAEAALTAAIPTLSTGGLVITTLVLTAAALAALQRKSRPAS